MGARTGKMSPDRESATLQLCTSSAVVLTPGIRPKGDGAGFSKKRNRKYDNARELKKPRSQVEGLSRALKESTAIQSSSSMQS